MVVLVKKREMKWNEKGREDRRKGACSMASEGGGVDVPGVIVSILQGEWKVLMADCELYWAYASFWPTVLSVAPLLQHVVCLSVICRL